MQRLCDIALYESAKLVIILHLLHCNLTIRYGPIIYITKAKLHTVLYLNHLVTSCLCIIFKGNFQWAIIILYLYLPITCNLIFVVFRVSLCATNS